MTVTHDEQTGVEYAPGYGAGGGPGDGSDDSGGGGGRRRPSRHRGRLALVSGLALAALAGGVAAWATTAGPAAPLTTAQVAARTNPGLVDVVSTLGYQHGYSAGTGMVLTPGGEVLTNNHVVEGATSIKVTDVGNGRTYSASVVGYDRADDVAVLRLKGASGLQTISVGDSSTVQVGDKVVGIGNAGGKGGKPSYATGKVTALGRSITASDAATGATERLSGIIQTNAGITAGDSGGPLVNSHGQVIGMDTAASSAFRFQTGQAQAQSFAIPINRALAIARQIEAGQSSAAVHLGATAFLGVDVASTSGGVYGNGGFGGQATSGVVIVGVIPSSPAAGAGLRPGDELTAVAGHQVSSPTAVQNVLERYHPGDSVKVSWLDGYGQTHTATVVLASGPVG